MATQQIVYMAAKFGKFRSPKSRLISDAYAERNRKQPLGDTEWLHVKQCDLLCVCALYN